MPSQIVGLGNGEDGSKNNMSKRLPKLPELLNRKIYKSGQTRGADDDEIYQNRVGRNSTVLIRFDIWRDILFKSITDPEYFFERGFIVLISPADYFASSTPDAFLSDYELELGQNCLVFYQQRTEWEEFNPDRLDWKPASSRISPLGGQYVARIHATTALEQGERISCGFNTTGMKGAGIRVYEYANKATMEACRLQLEAIFWLCHNSIEAVVEFGMSEAAAKQRREAVLEIAKSESLLDLEKLHESRIINSDGITMCPLCLEPLDAFGFFNRKAQAKGREKFDLTITELNLFHIEELRPGLFNHRPYNLGWGHHLCNVVIGDEGIDDTIRWMQSVVEKNMEYYCIDF